MNDVAARGTAMVDDIRQERADGTVFIFTHGFFIRCLVGRYLGWDHAGIRRNVVDNASATLLNFVDEAQAPEVTFNSDTQA